MLHPFIAKTEEERKISARSIGPVWDGNEVWLLAGGGTLYFAFPLLYASAFSGFYLALMIVLWLLIIRGCSIELRSQVSLGVWRTFFDGMFCFSSALLAIFFGAALANVIRGVPLGPDGLFHCEGALRAARIACRPDLVGCRHVVGAPLLHRRLPDV